MQWTSQIKTSGWEILLQPDFLSVMESKKALQRILPNADDATTKICNEINKLCASKGPNERGFPKSGHFKILKNKKVPIIEVSVTGDYRLLYYVIKPGELIIYTVTDHKGVDDFGRSSAASVHNTPMDDYVLSEYQEEYEVDLEDENIDQDAAIKEIKEKLSERGAADEEDEYLKTASRCAIYRLGEHGIELKTTAEQDDRIASPSPLLLPGVAGTGKSTILQRRYSNLLNGSFDENKFKEDTVYLTFNDRLAKETESLIKSSLAPKLHGIVTQTIKSLLEFSKQILIASGQIKENEFISKNQVTYRVFFNWWKKRTKLKNYDPALGWEDYRGVIRGSKESLDVELGTLSKEHYVALSRDRTACPKDERERFYDDMIGPFTSFVKEEKYDWDDQDLARKMIQHFQKHPMYRNIFIDEVQDLTELQLLSLLILVRKGDSCICSNTANCACRIECPECKCIVFDAAGDISQQVYPSRFRWEDAKQLIYDNLEVECELAKPLSMGYRSVRSIVDLANWYLKKMNVKNMQFNTIKESLNTERGIVPSVIVEDPKNLDQLIFENNLPLPHCPLIVRDQRTKEYIITKISEEQEGKKLDFDSSKYVFTIAEVKGLEFDYVITWDITSGSESIIKKKSHEKRGKYIDADEWLLQMEYKHVFVAITRSRVLLLELSPTVPKEIADNKRDPHLLELIEEKLILDETPPYDLSRFTDVTLTDEQYLKLAKDYEEAEMFSSAVGVYRKIGLEGKAIYCEYMNSKVNEEYIEMAKSGQDLTDFVDEFDSNELRQIHNDCADRLSELSSKSPEILKLVIFHARKLGDDDILHQAEAELLESDARKSGRRILWEKAAEKWLQTKKIRKAARAFWKASKYKEAANYYNSSGKQMEDFRDAAMKYLEALKRDVRKVKIGLLIPSYFGKIENEFTEIFGFKPDDKFLILPPKYSSLSEIDNSGEVKDIIIKIRKQQHKDDPERLAKLNFDSGEITAALDIMRDAGKFEIGFRTYGLELSWARIKSWCNTNSATANEKLIINKCKFESIDLNSIPKLINFLVDCPETGGESGEPRDFDLALKLIYNPKSLADSQSLENISTILTRYLQKETFDCDDGLLLHTIRTAILRIIHITEIEEGDYGTYDKDLLMLYSELVIKYYRHPNRISGTKHYNTLRRIIIMTINKTKLFDPLDILFDWLLTSGSYIESCKPALTDLTTLVVFFNRDKDDKEIPSFLHNWKPGDSLTRNENSFTPPSKIRKVIITEKLKRTSGYKKKIISYYEKEEGWWDKTGNLWKCLNDLFEFNKVKDVDFDKIFRERYLEIEKIIPFVSKSVSNPKLAITSDGNISKNREEQKPQILKPDFLLQEENLNTQESHDIIEDEPSELDVALPEEEMTVTPFIDILGKYPVDTVDPLEWLKEELDYAGLIQSGSNNEDIFSNLYELNKQIGESINDDDFSNDILAAAVWVQSDEIRNELSDVHHYKSGDYTEYQKSKFKGLRDRLSGGNDTFWGLPWCQKVISLKMTL